MKRTPLSRRTPLAAMSRKRAQQTKWARRNSTIASVSVKRRRENRERTKLLAEMRQRNPLCARCGARTWTDGHELKRRSAGGSITDPRNVVGLCRPCHTYITEHPKYALENGWQLSRFGGRNDAA